MKKLLKVLFSISLIFILINKVEALTLEEKELHLAKGETKEIEVTENFSEKIKKLEFNLVYYNNDITGTFQVNSSYQDKTSGIKHEIVFPNGVSGELSLGKLQVFVTKNSSLQKGIININNVQATTLNGKILNLENISLPIFIDSKKENTVTGNLIEKIDSNLVNISLKENTYEYKVTVKEDIKELDLKPITKYQDTIIDISSQKLEKEKNNIIIITAKKDNIEEEYKIQVKYQKDIKIDTHKYKEDNSYKKKWIIIASIFSVIFIIGLFLFKKEK